MIIGILGCGIVTAFLSAAMSLILGLGFIEAVLAYSLGGVLGVGLFLVAALYRPGRRAAQTA